MVEKRVQNHITIIFTLIFVSVAPLILIPIELVIPYPHIVEELAKLLIIFFVIQLNKNSQFKLVLISSFLFAFSESMFYLGSAYSGGYAFLFAQKLLLTTLFHTSTLLLFLFSARRAKKLLFIALPMAILWHFLFNQVF